MVNEEIKLVKIRMPLGEITNTKFKITNFRNDVSKMNKHSVILLLTRPEVLEGRPTVYFFADFAKVKKIRSNTPT